MADEKTTDTERGSGRILGVLLGVWTLALVVVGAVWLTAAWGQVTLAAGVVSALVVVGAAMTGRWLPGLYGVLLTTAVGIIVAGAVLPAGELIASGLLAVIVVGATAPIALSSAASAASDALEPGDRGGDQGTSSRGDVRDLLYQIHEHSMLSDNAKRVLFRERELGMLRDAIEVDIREGKHDVALTLCDEMADVFGYVEEAEAFRARILESRQASFDAEVMHALSQLDERLAARDWASAHLVAGRMRRLYADSHLIGELDRRIVSAREEHKRELERGFLEAAHKDDVEAAMSILKQLDRYLSREEAARLSEVAQGVVVRHRENLGVQFKLAVNDHRWAESVAIGEALIGEFPNTKMADEVRSMIDLLRARADRATLSTG